MRLKSNEYCVTIKGKEGKECDGKNSDIEFKSKSNC